MEDSRYQIAANMALEVFEDGALVLNLTEVTLHEFNPTARDILALTDGQHSLQQVAQHLAQEYEIDLETARQDVIELYNDLTGQGIITEIQVQTGKEN